MDDKQFDQIMARLERIMSLLAVDVVKGLDSDEQIARLSDLKFQPMEIAPIVGKTPNAVRVALFYIRRKKVKGEEAAEIPMKSVESTGQEGVEPPAKD